MAREVMEEMRKLPLDDAANADANDGDGMDLDRDDRRSGAGGDRGKGADGNSVCLTIESLSRGFARRPDLVAALLKSVKDTPPSGPHPPADAWFGAGCGAVRGPVGGVLGANAAAGGSGEPGHARGERRGHEARGGGRSAQRVLWHRREEGKGQKPSRRMERRRFGRSHRS